MSLFYQDSLSIARTHAISKGLEKRSINLLNLFVDTGLIIACLYLFFSGQDIPFLMTSIVAASHVAWELKGLRAAKKIRSSIIDQNKN